MHATPCAQSKQGKPGSGRQPGSRGVQGRQLRGTTATSRCRSHRAPSPYIGSRYRMPIVTLPTVFGHHRYPWWRWRKYRKEARLFLLSMHHY